jgi:hypothetical protein
VAAETRKNQESKQEKEFKPRFPRKRSASRISSLLTIVVLAVYWSRIWPHLLQLFF